MALEITQDLQDATVNEGEQLELSVETNSITEYGDGFTPFDNGDWVNVSGTTSFSETELTCADIGSANSRAKNATITATALKSVRTVFRVEQVGSGVVNYYAVLNQTGATYNRVSIGGSGSAEYKVYSRKNGVNTDSLGAGVAAANGDIIDFSVVFHNDDTNTATIIVTRSGVEVVNFSHTSPTPILTDCAITPNAYGSASYTTYLRAETGATYKLLKDSTQISTDNPYVKTAEASDAGEYQYEITDGVDTIYSRLATVSVNSAILNGTVTISGTPIKFRSYKPSPMVSYELKAMSDGSMRSVDRLSTTDSFTTNVTFRGAVEERDELLAILKSARDTRTPLVMTDFAVPLFGDHVDYSQPLTVYVVSQTVPDMVDTAKTQSFSIVFRIAGQVDTSGDDTIPSLECVRYSTSGGYKPNAILLSSYSQNLTKIDAVKDTPTFTGEYDMSPSDAGKMLRFWRTQRGEPFQISDLGTTNPFGERFTAPYICYIISVDVEPMFNNLRRVKLTLSLRS